jgi:hypothetical protein
MLTASLYSSAVFRLDGLESHKPKGFPVKNEPLVFRLEVYEGL